MPPDPFPPSHDGLGPHDSAPPSATPPLSILEAALDRVLGSDSLLPLPLGLVSKVLARLDAEPVPEDAGARAVTHGGNDVLSRFRVVAAAAAAVVAIGVGLGGLWLSATGGAFDAPPFDAPPFVEWASATRESTESSVRSLTALPDRVPGSPAALGAGAVLLFGAAVLGVRSTSKGTTTR